MGTFASFASNIVAARCGYCTHSIPGGLPYCSLVATSRATTAGMRNLSRSPTDSLTNTLPHG